jgi:HK97 family phage prohead protease
MSKEFKAYESKSLSLKIEDVDEGSRKVVGYLSAFDTLDSDNDIIRKGAFAKSIKERGVESSSNRQIAHLRNHDWEQQIGKFLEVYEDDFGLKFVSKLGRSTKGNDALLDYQDGILREHSIGFNYVKDKISEVEDSNNPQGKYYEIQEVKLWEGSGVTFGANEFTPVLDVAKSVLESDYLLKLNNEMESLVSAIKNGKGTDDRLHNIEMRLKLIQTKYNSLIEQLEPKSVKQFTPDNEPNELEIMENEKKQLFIKLINI